MSSTLKAMLSNKTIEPNDGRSPCIEVTDIKYETFMVRVMIELTFSFMNASCFIRESITHFLSLSFEGWKTLSVYTSVYLVDSAVRFGNTYAIDIDSSS